MLRTGLSDSLPAAERTLASILLIGLRLVSSQNTPCTHSRDYSCEASVTCRFAVLFAIEPKRACHMPIFELQN